MLSGGANDVGPSALFPHAETPTESNKAASSAPAARNTVGRESPLNAPPVRTPRVYVHELAEGRGAAAVRRLASRWRSTRSATFVREFNGESTPDGNWRERFPRRLWLTLVLASVAVTLVAIAVRIPLLGSFLKAPDSGYYLAIGEGVFHGGGYASNLRPPAYSTLLAILELFGANPANAAVVLQNLIGMMLPTFVLLVGWRFFSPFVGVIAGFLAAASPLMIAIEQFVLTDYLFSVVLLIAAVLLAEAVLRLRDGPNAWPLLVAAGVMFGLASLFRANGIYGLVAIPAALLIAGPRWKPALRASAIATGALVVVIAPWCIHNLIRFGDPNVASEGGLSLYGRAISYDQVKPSADTASGRLALGIYNTADPNKQEAVIGTTAYVYNALVEEAGQDPIEAANTMAGLAGEAILAEPGTYLRDSLQILGRYQGAYYPRTLTGRENADQISLTTEYLRALDPSEREPPDDSALTRGPWRVAQAITQVLFILSCGGLLLLALPFLGDRRSRLAASTFLTVGILGIVGVTLTARFELRHGVVFAPLIWILAPAAVSVGARFLYALLRSLPRPRIRHATT
jgi:4-amino-4-deoxy-L-arabinose transferase-like glycosyltransferase